MKKYLFLIFLVFAISCKKHEEPTKKKQKTEFVQKKSIFEIKIEGYFSKDDYILFFYENEEGKGFNNIQKLTKGYKGSKEKQIVTFTLPEDENLLDFSLHISDKIGQKITINNFIITDGFDTIEIKKDSLFNYIRPNEYIRVRDDGNFDLITKDINGLPAYNPIFKCQAILKNKLKFI